MSMCVRVYTSASMCVCAWIASHRHDSSSHEPSNQLDAVVKLVRWPMSENVNCVSLNTFTSPLLEHTGSPHTAIKVIPLSSCRSKMRVFM